MQFCGKRIAYNSDFAGNAFARHRQCTRRRIKDKHRAIYINRGNCLLGIRHCLCGCNYTNIKKSIQFFIKLTDFSIIIQYIIWVIVVALRNPKLAFAGNGRRNVHDVCKGNDVRCACARVNGGSPWKYRASAIAPKNNIHPKFLYHPLCHGGFP